MTSSARVTERRTAGDAGIFDGSGRAGFPLSLTAARTVPLSVTRRGLDALARVTQALAESSPSPADMSGTRRLSHPS